MCGALMSAEKLTQAPGKSLPHPSQKQALRDDQNGLQASSATTDSECLEQSCSQLERGLGLFDAGVLRGSIEVRLEACVRAFLERTNGGGPDHVPMLENMCGGLESGILQLQDRLMQVPKLQVQLADAQKKEVELGEQVKKLRDKVAALHRTQMSLDEEVRDLKAAKNALEIERRRVEFLKTREDEELEKKARDCEVAANAIEELDETNRSLKEALEASMEETARMNQLLHERDAEITELQAQLKTQDAEREAEMLQQKAEVMKSAQESMEREQFLELSLNRSMQEAYLVTGVQVCFCGRDLLSHLSCMCPCRLLRSA